MRDATTVSVHPAIRKAQGKALREKLHRTDQSKWSPALDRPDPVKFLEQRMARRIAELLPIKWQRMAESPFAFLRGASALFAYDLKPWPTSGLQVQLCGDAHVLNLGAYAGPDAKLVFDLNDFDEAAFGAWEWDLKRLVASLVLAGRQAGQADASCTQAVAHAVSAYRAAMARFAEMSYLGVFRSAIGAEHPSQSLAEILRKAERDTPTRVREKATSAGKLKLSPPLVRGLGEPEWAILRAAWPAYRDTLSAARRHLLDQYTAKDLAFRVVGTGSVGLLDWIVLCEGNGPDDLIFLQFKGQEISVWAEATEHEGKRVAEAQLRLQTVSDPFLGWTTLGSTPCVVRQWHDHKASVEVNNLKAGVIQDYAALCGEVLAKAHARSSDAAQLSGYLGDSPKLDQALTAFAVLYADQSTRDWEIFCKRWPSL